MKERDCTIDFICPTLFVLALSFLPFSISLFLSERIPLGFRSLSTFIFFVLRSQHVLWVLFAKYLLLREAFG
jgi:hypothetical protein